MSASSPKRPAAFETDVDDFEDVALLLETDQQQQHSRKQPSWTSRFLKLFARGGPREHAGFEKLDQTDDSFEASGRQQGEACSILCLYIVLPDAGLLG